MDIRINVDGASTKEIERGLAAAWAVFNKAGISPEQAADAVFSVEGWDVKDFPTTNTPTTTKFSSAAFGTKPTRRRQMLHAGIGR